jgi:hypothetical protein
VDNNNPKLRTQIFYFCLSDFGGKIGKQKKRGIMAGWQKQPEAVIGLIVKEGFSEHLRVLHHKF